MLMFYLRNFLKAKFYKLANYANMYKAWNQMDSLKPLGPIWTFNMVYIKIINQKHKFNVTIKH